MPDVQHEHGQPGLVAPVAALDACRRPTIGHRIRPVTVAEGGVKAFHYRGFGDASLFEVFPRWGLLLECGRAEGELGARDVAEQFAEASNLGHWPEGIVRLVHLVCGTKNVVSHPLVVRSGGTHHGVDGRTGWLRSLGGERLGGGEHNARDEATHDILLIRGATLHFDDHLWRIFTNERI